MRAIADSECTLVRSGGQVAGSTACSSSLSLKQPGGAVVEQCVAAALPCEAAVYEAAECLGSWNPLEVAPALRQSSLRLVQMLSHVVRSQLHASSLNSFWQAHIMRVGSGVIPLMMSLVSSFLVSARNTIVQASGAAPDQRSYSKAAVRSAVQCAA